MPLGEADTRAKLIDPAIHARGWTEDLIRREVTAGALALDEMMDYDLYDVLAELGYGLAPRTRPQRAEAFTYKHERWLATLPSSATATLKALASQFARSGTDGREHPQVFEPPEVTRAGGLPALRALDQPAEILRQTKERLFAA